MRPQPLICVTDVEASSRWYQRLLGCRGAHGGKQYEQLVKDGSLILQLHSFEVEHHHGRIADPADRPYGNGLLLGRTTGSAGCATQTAIPWSSPAPMELRTATGAPARTCSGNPLAACSFEPEKPNPA